MPSECTQDPYTTIPRRSRGLRRDRGGKSDSDGHHGVLGLSETSRTTLLRLLQDTVAREQDKLNVLLSSTSPPLALCSESPECRSPQAHSNSRVEDLRIVDKNEYLKTPIRLKLFPRASPTVLRTLLASPPPLGPDFYLDITGLPLSDSPSDAFDRSISHASPQLSARKTRRFARCYSDFDGINLITSSPRPSAGFPTSAPRPDLPPSPPPSAELPCSEFLPQRPESVPVSSPPLHPSLARSARPASLGLAGPYVATRRSSHERSPLSQSSVLDAISSPARRAAPCVPIVTRAASVSANECDGGEGGDEGLLSMLRPSTHPWPGLSRPSDPRLLMRNDLAFGVVRDFQRVLDELQGLGCDQSGCTESLGDQRSHGVPPHAHSPPYASSPGLSPSPSPPAEFQDLMCGPDRAHPRRRDPGPVRSQPAGIVLAELAEHDAATASGALLPSLGPDLENANEDGLDAAPAGAKPPTPGGFSSWERRLRLADCGPPRSAGGSHAGGASPLRPPSSFSGLQEEFVTLLSDQALEEESHAQLLREIAERLEEMARCRRHLAAATAMKQL
ncbi:hypothetical protein C8Q80DRAFT_571742 [Daedaleopsis nitida]|nr:hypothetical protein C8Q80DRAFT_571742 [Daedaleopsis nitida]